MTDKRYDARLKHTNDAKSLIDNQAAAHQFLLAHLDEGSPFTIEQFRKATRWPTQTFNTYWSKRFKQIVKRSGGNKYRVAGIFERYRALSAFRRYMSQATSAADYARSKFPTVVMYEFYLPLAHETTLRRTLDALFYEDSVVPRLKRMNQRDLEASLPSDMLLADVSLIDRARNFVNEKFSGYSIYHVNGRFRCGNLMMQASAAASSARGEPYLIDETTAVVRFIFPCASEAEANTTRLLFHELFVQPIIDVISGEDQIWMIETGLGASAHVWKNQQSQNHHSNGHDPATL